MKTLIHHLFHKIMLVVICLNILTVSIFAETIQIVTTDFPPYAYKKDGKMVGLATEVLQAILADLGMNIKIRQYPWARAYKMATEEKNVLIYTLARTPVREGKFHFIGEVAPRVVYFFKLKSRNDIQIRSLKELKKYKIGVVNDFAMHKRLKALGFPKIQTVTNDIQNIRKLFLGRID